jgi:hypothetical protein
MFLTKAIFSLILLLISLNAFANETSNDAWYGMFTKKKIDESYSWWTEAQLRYDIDDSSVQQTLFRTGLLRKANHLGGFGLLYAFIQAQENKEHRLALQHVKNYGSLDSFITSHRIRLELRTIEHAPNLSERFRYLIRFQKDTISQYAPVLWNEFFINLNEDKNINKRFLERNRLFLGYAFKKATDFKVEIGYLNQYTPKMDEDTIEHTLVLYLFF